MQRKIRWQLPFLLFLIIATVVIVRHHVGYSTDTAFTRPAYQKAEGAIFGTLYHATYQSRRDLTAGLERELAAVDSSLSMFNPSSTLSRINRGETDSLDDRLLDVLLLATHVSRATGGAFDVTVAPLVNAWGFGYKHGQLPSAAQVDSLRALVGYEGLHIEGRRLRKDHAGAVIDLSAIAKGYGTDRAARYLESQGVKNYLVEIGGEIVARGTNAKGETWRIAVEKPVDDSLCARHESSATLTLTDCAMATSGNYRNYHVGPDGQKRAHTIDPHTGRPVQHSLLSATVIAPTCAEADAYATSFMVLGLDGAKRVLNKQRHLRAYLIYDEGGHLRTYERM